MGPGGGADSQWGHEKVGAWEAWRSGLSNLGRWSCLWVPGAEGMQLSEGPVSPQGEMGGSGLAGASDPAEGSREKCH